MLATEGGACEIVQRQKAESEVATESGACEIAHRQKAGV